MIKPIESTDIVKFNLKNALVSLIKIVYIYTWVNFFYFVQEILDVRKSKQSKSDIHVVDNTIIHPIIKLLTGT